MEKTLLRQFGEFLEKQDMLNKLTESQKLNNFGYSEIHTIAAINNLENPNVTEIARQLDMTRGAISKVTKKLLEKKLIVAYTLPDNKQKIFFRLTPAGRELYDEHEKRHRLWEKRDEEFLSRFSDEEQQTMFNFMAAYNEYLQRQIEEITEEQYTGGGKQ